MEDIQTACQDCWVRDCGGRETAARAGGGRYRASLPRGQEGACPGHRVGASLHSSEVPLGDWLSLFMLDFLSPFSEPNRWLSAAHTAWLACWLLSWGFQPSPCPSPEAAPRCGGCWLPSSTLWRHSGDQAPRSFSSRALAVISAKRVLVGRRMGLGQACF